MKFVDINYEHSRNIFENSDKVSNYQNLKLHKCSEEKPIEMGVYIGYEQDDLLDQYLVIWDGSKWVHFESGGEIGFGSEYRDDHWSELPPAKVELPRYITTSETLMYQLQSLMNHIEKSDPNYFYTRKEIISENTELKFQEFLVSINKDLNDLRFN